jgi:hypothetical protein
VNDYPPPVIRLLEMAEQHPFADVPRELQNALTFCLSKGLVRIVDSVRIGQTAPKTVKKKAHELRLGDVIRFRPGDECGYVVKRITLHTHTVDVSGTGQDCQYRYGADVTVYDGPPPRPIYSQSKLQLLPDGEAALALHRMTGGAGSRHAETTDQGEGTDASGKRQMPANEAKVKLEDVPAELRDLGLLNGPVLTAPYLATTGGWDIRSVELTRAYKADELTYRLKVGNAYAYLYTELYTLRERRADRKDEA